MANLEIHFRHSVYDCIVKFITVFGWLVLIFYEKKILLARWCWWLVLVLCEREILLAGCSEDEANIVHISRFFKITYDLYTVDMIHFFFSESSTSNSRILKSNALVVLCRHRTFCMLIQFLRPSTQGRTPTTCPCRHPTCMQLHVGPLVLSLSKR